MVLIYMLRFENITFLGYVTVGESLSLKHPIKFRSAPQSLSEVSNLQGNDPLVRLSEAKARSESADHPAP
jgi:hypothetical protein